MNIEGKESPVACVSISADELLILERRAAESGLGVREFLLHGVEAGLARAMKEARELAARVEQERKEREREETRAAAQRFSESLARPGGKTFLNLPGRDTWGNKKKHAYYRHERQAAESRRGLKAG